MSSCKPVTQSHARMPTIFVDLIQLVTVIFYAKCVVEKQDVGHWHETVLDVACHLVEVAYTRVSQPVFRGTQVFRGKPPGVPREATRTTHKFNQLAKIYRPISSELIFRRSVAP